MASQFSSVLSNLMQINAFIYIHTKKYIQSCAKFWLC